MTETLLGDSCNIACNKASKARKMKAFAAGQTTKHFDQTFLQFANQTLLDRFAISKNIARPTFFA